MNLSSNPERDYDNHILECEESEFRNRNALETQRSDWVDHFAGNPSVILESLVEMSDDQLTEILNYDSVTGLKEIQEHITDYINKLVNKKMEHTL